MNPIEMLQEGSLVFELQDLYSLALVLYNNFPSHPECWTTSAAGYICSTEKVEK